MIKKKVQKKKAQKVQKSREGRLKRIREVELRVGKPVTFTANTSWDNNKEEGAEYMKRVLLYKKRFNRKTLETAFRHALLLWVVITIVIVIVAHVKLILR